MKKLTALTLALVLLISLIPAAFAGGSGGYAIYTNGEEFVNGSTLKVGETLHLDLYSDGGAPEDVQWTSSNPGVATIGKSGRFTTLKALKEGYVNITVEYVGDWGRKKQTITLKVIEVRPKLAGKIAVYVGESAKWTADKWVWWTSGNPGVATIDQQGNIKAHKAGKTHITATAADGSKMTVTFFVYNRAY